MFRKESKCVFALAALFAACGEEALDPTLPADSQDPQDSAAAADEPALDTAEDALAQNFCPAYTASAIRRARLRQITVGPTDDWMGAIRRAAAGTEILLRDGTYDMGGRYAVTVPAEVTLRSQSGDRTRVVIRNGGYAAESEGLMVTGANVTIADLTLRDIRYHGITVKGEMGANATQIYNVLLRDIGTHQIRATAGSQNGLVACSDLGYTAGRARGDFVGGVLLQGTTGWKLRDNKFSGFTGDGSGCVIDRSCGTQQRPAAVQISEGGSGAIVERNTLRENWRGVSLGAHSAPVVRNNFVLRTVAGQASLVLDGATNALIAHNTFRQTAYANALEARNATGLKVINNLASAALTNVSNAPLGAQGNLTNAADADFAAAGDWHIKAGNRAIGAGVRLDAVTGDMEGEARVDRWDVGADQGVASPVVQPPPPPPAPSPGDPVDYCPPFTQSSARRARARTVVVGPGDDWMGAIENASAGTEVLLRDGTYNHNRYSVQIRNDVTVRSQSGNRDAVIIRGQGYGPGAEAFFLRGANIDIADMTMMNFRYHAIAVKGEFGAHAPHIYNMNLMNIGQDHIKVTPGQLRDGLVACSSLGFQPGMQKGDYTDAFDMMEGINWVLRDNYIYNVVGDGTGCDVDTNCGTYVPAPAILIWRGSRGTVIERNVMVNNFRNIGIGLADSVDTDSVVRNNFIYRSGSGDAGIELWGAVNALVANNTVRVPNYRAAIHVLNTTNARIFNNFANTALWNRGNSTYDARNNLWDARDTDFLAPSDYHLRDGNRAIGAGIAVPGVTADIDGEPVGNRNDIGCDHWGG